MLRKVFLPLAILIIIGCGSSYPPNDVAENIFWKVANDHEGLFTSDGGKNITVKAKIENGEFKLIKLKTINKYKQNIRGEEYSVIEYEFSFGQKEELASVSYDRFTVGYIQRGNSWYGELVSSGNGVYRDNKGNRTPYQP